MARNKKKNRAAADLGPAEDSGSDAGAEVEVPEQKGAPAVEEASGSDAGDEKPQELTAKQKKEQRMAEIQARREKKGKGKGKGKGGKQQEQEQEKEEEEANSDEDGDDEGEIVVTRQEAVEVLYCPICTFPAEMCEFSGMMEKCRPWLQEHASELADAEERGRKRRMLTEKERLEAKLEGRGIKKALKRIVVIDAETRSGKRQLTCVFGMDLFGFNLKDISKEWRKAFACGVGVHAAEVGTHQDSVDIQGNVVDTLAEMLVRKYKVPKESVFYVVKKKNVPYFDDE